MNTKDRLAWAHHLDVPQQPVSESKWKNEKTKCDGYTFDSKAEERRYAYLRMMQKVGLIVGLEVHKKFVFHVNGFKMWSYTSDFAYKDVTSGVMVVEDVKNPANAKERSFRRNCLMMRALHGIVVKVVMNSKE